MIRRQRHLQCFDGLAPISDIKKCIKHGHSVLILMRGPPGCGKTYLANSLLDCRAIDDEDTRKPVVLSTDRYFYTANGRYAFDHTRLEEFHKKNREDARAAMENNQSPVIIDNTNMQLMHMKQYITMGVKNCYEIYVIDPSTSWRNNARELAKRNVHFVDELSIERMIAQFEEIQRFADLLKPIEFVVSRVELSDEESDDEGLPALTDSSTQSSNSGVLPSIKPGSESSSRVNSLTSVLPPGLFSPVNGQPQRQPSPIFSMSHEPLLSVHQRDVGCQATPGIVLLLEMNSEGPVDAASLCFSTGESRVAQRRRGAVTVDAETDTVCPPPNPISLFSVVFPDVPLEDIEQYAMEFPAGKYAELLLQMGYSMDYSAPIPWNTEDADRNNRTRKGRHKEAVAVFKESVSAPATPKKKNPVKTNLKLKSGRGEGCGAPAEDPSSSASLSNGYDWEDKVEPLAAAFTDDEELIALDMKQPIKNILELFFGHNSREPDVHMPMWLLRLLHRCARGDRLTRGSVYHQDFPSIDLCGMQIEEAQQQQQLRDDEEIARRMHAEEAQKHRHRSNSPTESFTADQIKSVRMLKGKYPTADGDSIALLFKDMGFNTGLTLRVLGEQFGEAAPGPAHTLPASVLAPPSFSSPSPVTRSSSNTSNFASVASSTVQQQSYGQRVQLHQSRQSVPTHLSNGRITDVGRMAAANGATMTQEQVRLDFIALHEKRQEKQQKLDEALKKAQSVKDHHTRGYYGQEIRRAKEARIEVEHEINELAKWWNENLNSDVIDLHWMLADQAMQMLKERIEYIKRGRGPRRLTVITGQGNNSVGGKAEIKQRVVSMCNSQGYNHHFNNTGCIIISF